MMLPRLKLNQRGDTLVEVTIALSIMSAVLTSSFLLADKSIQLGRIAKERTLMVSAAQQQAEALTALRDRVGWLAFKSAFTPSLLVSCTYGSPCFNIDPASLNLISGEGTVSGVGNSKIYITTDITNSPTPNPATFEINYEVQPSGGGPLQKSQVVLQLGNTDALRPLVVP